MSEAFAELFEEGKESLQATQGSLIEGTVARITDTFVTVDAGLKSEGLISTAEFRGKDDILDIDVGDRVEVVLESLEDGFGKTRMSRSRARQLKVWGKLSAAHDNGEIIRGTIINRVKGGFTVDVEGVTAFLPGSLMDIKPTRETNTSYLEGKEFEFKVIKLDQARNNIVVSRKAALENFGGGSREEMEKYIQEGAVIKGIVKHLTDYGAFVGINGFDGLLHIADMAWKRVREPSEVVAIGDEIEVKVLKFDRDKGRISLGLKQLTEDPWDRLVDSHTIGDRVKGVVTSTTEYGAFVSIEDELEGLVHISELDWTNRNVPPAKVVSPGDQVEVMIIAIDKDKRRISLGLKQCTPNPWETCANKYSKGDKFTGVVKSINDFGLFVGIPDSGIDGLVHSNDLSVTEAPEKAILNYKKGDEIEVMVLSVDVDRERVALSVKALQSDPLQDYLNEHPKGSVISAKVSEITDTLVMSDLVDKVRGSIAIDEFKNEQGELSIAVGDTVEVKVLGIDRKSYTLKLSMKLKERDDEKRAVASYSHKKPATSKFGDFLSHPIDTVKGLFKE